MDEASSPAQKYCHACGGVIDIRAEICPKCGVRQFYPTGHYSNPLQPNVPHSYQQPQSPQKSAGTIGEASEKKVICAICAILFGRFGVHKFILGYQKAGAIMLSVTVGLSLASSILFRVFRRGPFDFEPFIGYGYGYMGVGVGVMGMIGLIEGLIYLSLTDKQFHQTYLRQTKEWF